MLAAEGDCAHAQLLALALYGNASITGFPLIVVGLIIDLYDLWANRCPLGSGRSLRFDALAKNR